MGEPDTWAMEPNQTGERREPPHRAGQPGLGIHRVDRNEAFHDDEDVTGRVAQDFVGDVHVVRAGVADVPRHRRYVRLGAPTSALATVAGSSLRLCQAWRGALCLRHVPAVRFTPAPSAGPM